MFSVTATIVNGGKKVTPTLLIPSLKKDRRQIFSKETSLKMRSIMRLVVSHEHGTATKAKAPGYLVRGKTGTAEKISASGR